MKKNKLFAFAILLFSAGLSAQVWDERPGADFTSVYEQDFTGGVWDQATFDAQWSQIGAFTGTDIANGYLEFIWVGKRILFSVPSYKPPYSLEAKVAYGNPSNRGGVILRAGLLNENLQEPANGDPGYNKEAIAFYPLDSDSMIIQFTAADDVTQAQIHVVKPAGAVDLLAAPYVLRLEDYGSAIYAFIDDAPFARIELTDLVDGVYSSGTVYDADMKEAGSFTGMEVLEVGHVAITQRDAWLRLHSAKISDGVYTDTHDLTFNVTSGGVALEGATVVVGLESVDTDVNGDAVFPLINGDYSYGVYKFGYEAASGSVSVAGDAVTEAVSLTARPALPAYEFATDYEVDFAGVAAWTDTEAAFDAQWDQIDDIQASSFTANSHLSLSWVPQRVLTSKKVYDSVYVMEAELDYPSPTTRGGIVIRHDPAVGNENMQEPGNIVDILPMFNREGIAIFPTLTGTGMYVQFSGPISVDNNGYSTHIERLEVPAPADMNFREKGMVRVEDYGKLISVFYKDVPVVRIELDGLTGINYTSGNVYTGNMVPVGAFSGVEIIDKGKAGIAIRNDVGGTVSLNIHSIIIKTMVTVPGAPANVTAVAGDTEATVSFDAPASDGGSPITSYTVTSIPEGISASGTESPITVNGLTNGISYTFTVTAISEIGSSEASEASNAVVPAAPATVPDAPTAVMAALGENWDEASVSFTAPASDGGAAITGYTVTSTPGGITATGTESPILVSGLSLNTAYTFTVRATNEVGDSEESAASNEVTTPETTSVEDRLTDGVRVYQNAAGIMLDMKSFSGLQNVRIYSLTGRTVAEYQLNGGAEHLIGSSLSAGAYLIGIQNDSDLHTLKIVVR